MTAYQSTSSLTYALDDEAWWVQRWVELLNTYRFKKRLERGRIYAREGHILSLEYKGSKVTALVQGTAEDPYKLSIWLDAFSDEARFDCGRDFRVFAPHDLRQHFDLRDLTA